ncbi:MAG: phasin family protein [Aquabacterium sp.]|nr:phasin family protein [Aquabacterium sp.]
MVKRLQKMADKRAAASAGLLDSQLAQTIKDSAQQIWLAGLGAFAKAHGEGGKAFDTLMKEGASLQRKTQAAAEGELGNVAGKMSAMAGEMGSKANAQWDKLESIFEERTARALGRLGMPAAQDLATLADRVAALEAAVAALAALKGDAPQAAKVPKFKPGKALKSAVGAAAPKPAARTARKPAAAPVVATAVRRRKAAAGA